MKNFKTAIIIPARLESSRLKEKVLIDLKGKTMLQRVYERAKLANVGEVFIATDSKKIQSCARQFTKNIIMTSSHHQSGTDRIAEAVLQINCNYIINIQADEPLLEIGLIHKLQEKLQKKSNFVSAAYPLKAKKEICDSAKVKVVFNAKNQAIYFSRLPIPYNTDFKADYYCHIGVYGYSRDFLLTYTKLAQTPLEISEKLEQLRALENNYSMDIVLTDKPSLGVDTPADVKRVLGLFTTE